MEEREEKDTLGTVRVPADVYYGAQTQRAVENFPVSGMRLPPVFIRSLALLKKCAALVNRELGLLDPEAARAIAAAATEVMEGKHAEQFVVDVFQTGSGTSTNMNMNEVLATRANEIMTGRKNGRDPIHPNDHVNLGQSSNDVIPSAIHLAALQEICGRLLPALSGLQQVLSAKAAQFADIRKIGRTHLQDAVPMMLGQEFSGYARQVELGIKRLETVKPRLAELALGGTAVGTGLNTHPEFACRVIRQVAAYSRLPFCEAENHFAAQAGCDAAVEASGALKTISVSLIKIANDLRWLNSGPRCGIGEIRLPALQPGSSMMPGKVNPVIPEAVIQVAAQVLGNDLTITIGGQAGNFELNVMLPVIAFNLLQSIELLAAAAGIFSEKCLRGIEADRARCEAFIEKSLALATPLVPHIGYERAAGLARKAHAGGKTIRQVLMEEHIIPENEIDKILAGA